MARKRFNPDSKLVKIGVSVSPDMLRDLDYLAAFTCSSRSTVLCALVEDHLFDVAEDCKEKVYSARLASHAFVPTGHCLEFLTRVSQHRNKQGSLIFVAPPVLDAENEPVEGGS